MKRSFLAALALLTLATFTGVAQAELVRVTVLGTVESNQIGGNQAGVAPGDPVSMAFTVDSADFVDSTDFPTRGYVMDLASFEMTVGSAPVPILNPQSFGSTAYFVLRNNDPAVDGFFLSRNVDVPQPLFVNIPGLDQVHELDFSRTFDDDTPLPSLNILDALGTYGTENLSSYDWTIGRFGTPGAYYTYQSITLAVVPEPSTWVLLGFGAVGAGIVALRRRQVVA